MVGLELKVVVLPIQGEIGFLHQEDWNPLINLQDEPFHGLVVVMPGMLDDDPPTELSN